MRASTTSGTQRDPTAVALLLARESKGLLIGERADPALTSAIMSLARGIGGVNDVATIHLARTGGRLFQRRVRRRPAHPGDRDGREGAGGAHPQVLLIFVKPETAHEAAARAERRAGITIDS